MSTWSAILSRDPKPARDIKPAVPRGLEKIISRCLRKDPERRWQSIADVKVSLQEVLEEDASGKPTEIAGFSQRRTRQVTIVAGLFACVAALVFAPCLTDLIEDLPRMALKVGN